MSDIARPAEFTELDARDEQLRSLDRQRVAQARASHRPLWLFFLLAGPGILVMLGENDGPSMLSYATTGAAYGIGFFLPFIVLTFAMAFVVQEMTVRLGIATRCGHAELIFERFGPFWGYFSMLDLAIGNILTLITEFIAIRAGAAYFGISAPIAVGVGAALVLLMVSARRYFTWERAVLVLAAFNLLFVPAAMFAHPDAAAVARAFGTWSPLAGGVTAGFVTLLMADVGATVTPWMIFFQQSAVVDKGLTAADLPQGRFDTALGALVAAVAAIAAVLAAVPLFTHHVVASTFAGGADFATALHPYIGSVGAALFALGMIEAGLVAAMTISTSSAYAVGEVLRAKHSLNASFSSARAFYVSLAASVALAAAVVLIPHAPLLAITIAVNVIATLLMAPALLFLLLLANDREVIGSLANGPKSNLIGGAIVIAIALMGSAYGVITVFPQVIPK
ncbi:MAG TPA: divalent metal cation transporter [Candidatus Eremiobacteraceae bacterium]|nr:divalent metal cation transporter [Candidatus Eremiobacteraceae bacterium]